MLKKLWKTKAGFTLMELIIVIVILGILALIAIPRLLGFTNQAKLANDKEYAAVVARAAELYWAANNEKEPDIGSLVNLGLVDDNASALKYVDGTDVEISIDDGVCTVDISDGEIIYNTVEGYTAP